MSTSTTSLEQCHLAGCLTIKFLYDNNIPITTQKFEQYLHQWKPTYFNVIVPCNLIKYDDNIWFSLYWNFARNVKYICL